MNLTTQNTTADMMWEASLEINCFEWLSNSSWLGNRIDGVMITCIINAVSIAVRMVHYTMRMWRIYQANSRASNGFPTHPGKETSLMSNMMESWSHALLMPFLLLLGWFIKINSLCARWYWKCRLYFCSGGSLKAIAYYACRLRVQRFMAGELRL